MPAVLPRRPLGHPSGDAAKFRDFFRTLKYRPGFPSQAFASITVAQGWVDGFVAWYNTEHLHSAIRFITPDDRHFGREAAILAHREQVYKKARETTPERWAQNTRNWQPVEAVYLNPTMRGEQTPFETLHDVTRGDNYLDTRRALEAEFQPDYSKLALMGLVGGASR